MQRKKLKNRIITGTMLSVIILALTGCFGSSDSEERKAGALEYLENKYDESFYIINYSEPNWSESTYDYTVIPSAGDYEGKEFEVIGTYDNDQMEYCDTYINMVKHDEYIEKIQTLAEDYFENALIYGEITNSYGTEFTKDMTIEDAAGILTGTADILVPKDSISKENYDAACDAITDTLRKENCYVFLNIRSLICDKSEVITEEKYKTLVDATDNKATLFQWDFFDYTGE